MSGPFLLLAFAFLVVAFAPDSEMGRTLRSALVDRPARLLNGGPLKIFVSIIILAGLVAFVLGAPERVALIGMTDLTVYLDLVALSFIVGAVSDPKSAMRAGVQLAKRSADAVMSVPARLQRLPGRIRRTRRPRQPVGADDGHAWGAWAAA
jgi:hypothetical protein